MQDPNFITSADWSATGKLLTSLWFFVACAIGVAFTFLTAHAIIPSLLGTRELPESVQRIRPLIYLTSIFAVALVTFFLVSAIDLAGTIDNFYARRWI